MKKIILISTYFGSFPNYFNLWLKSAKSNADIDFLIYSDCDSSKYQPLPKNVNIVATSFDDLKSRVQECFDFKISLNAPYKLCDFRPAFGEIFKDDIAGYDYWGHYDLDMIFGDLMKYIPKEDYDKIYYSGHLTLYKNTEQNNSVYKLDGGMNYKDVFTTDIGMVFDEKAGNHEKYVINNLPIFTQCYFADITKRKQRFTLSVIHDQTNDKIKNNYDYQIFYQENGKIFRDYIEDNKISSQEFSYIHFSSREMPDYTNGCESYYITNTGFHPKNGATTKEIIEKYNPLSPTKDKLTALKWKKNDAVRKIKKIIQKGKER